MTNPLVALLTVVRHSSFGFHSSFCLVRPLFVAGCEAKTATPGTTDPRGLNRLNRARSQSRCVTAPAKDLLAPLAERARLAGRRAAG